MQQAHLLSQNEKYRQIGENLLLYITVICSFAIVEGMIGISHTNVHIVRDFLNCLLMVCALVFSSKALEMSNKANDEIYNFGYRRYNILAAFINTVYLLFSFMFGFVDNLHHIVEHWEAQGHSADNENLKFQS
jgi:Co/Zn/Cd efflux system component